MSLILVFSLFIGLSDERFDVREESHQKLLHLVDRDYLFYGPILKELVNKTDNPESYKRGSRILTVYYRNYIDNYIPPTPMWACCDMFCINTFGTNIRIPKALDVWFDIAIDENYRLRESSTYHNTNGPHWWQHRRATELYIRDALRRGATYKECDELLVNMWDVEVIRKLDCKVMPPIPPRWFGGYYHLTEYKCR